MLVAGDCHTYCHRTLHSHGKHRITRDVVRGIPHESGNAAAGITPEIDRAMMVKGFLVFECYPFLNHALFEPRRYSSSASAIAAASPKDRMPSLRSGRSAGRSSTWSNRETSSAGSRHSADLCARLSRSIPEQPLLSRRTRRENPLALAIHRASVALSRHN